jgi:16S rRNA (guanine966-N2)-methyltransferase
MKLRIISGSLKGRILSLPDKIAGFRPTKDRVRQSLAEIIKENIPGASVADLCAGSGAFGFECASRGARCIHFVERTAAICRNISTHLEAFGIAPLCKVFVQDVRQFIMRPPCDYDIVFFDPPYDDEALAGLVPSMLSLLSEKGIFVYEYSVQRRRQRQVLEFPKADSYIFTTRIYGETAVDIMYKKNN